MHAITRKRIIAVELILLLIVSSITGYILLRNFNLLPENGQVDEYQEIDIQIDSDMTQGEVPLEIEFFTNTNIGHIKTTSYDWDFGDGALSSDRNPTHIFQQPGTYHTTLTITDSKGNNKTDTITIQVEESIPPEAHIDVSTITGVRPLLVHFDGNKDNDERIVSYRWDFGPKFRSIVPESTYRHSLFFRFLLYHYLNSKYSSIKQDPSMVFIQSGEYWVSLTITDDQGQTDTDTVWIHVYNVDTYDDT